MLSTLELHGQAALRRTTRLSLVRGLHASAAQMNRIIWLLGSRACASSGRSRPSLRLTSPLKWYVSFAKYQSVQLTC